MANLLTSSQTQSTSVPQFYSDYLSNLASQGKQAVDTAQFVGAQPLQQQAFEQVGGAATAYQPTLQQAGDVLTQASGSQSPLSAATPYLATAATNNPALMAESYMSPYARMAAQQMSDIAQRNIRQNLAPGATSAAVGSGQFGSQRGAQVLGQVEEQANQDLNSQIAQMLNTGYGQALTAAGQQQQLLGNLGNIAGTQASQGQQNLTQAGQALGNLAGTNQQLGLAGINALSTLGGQQQTIGQNAQNYPLTKLANLAALLQGQQIPSTVKTELQSSPLSALAALASGTAGLFQGSGANGTGPSIFQQLTGTGPAGSGTGILSQVQNWLKPNTGGATEITNPATPGSEGYGWKYYSDGTAISPSGDYYQNGQMIWSPTGSNNADTTNAGSVGGVDLTGGAGDPNANG